MKNEQQEGTGRSGVSQSSVARVYSLARRLMQDLCCDRVAIAVLEDSARVTVFTERVRGQSSEHLMNDLND